MSNILHYAQSWIAATTAVALALTFSFAYAPPTAAATDLFSDGFESGNTDAWDTADGVDVVSNNAAEGDYFARFSEPFNGEEDDELEYDTLTEERSTAGYEDIMLTFQYQTTDYEPDDELLVQIRTEDDGDWETIETIDETDESTPWEEMSINLSADASDNEDFAFRFVSFLDSEFDLFHLDDVELIGTTMEDENGRDDDDEDEDEQEELLNLIEQIVVSFEAGGSDVLVHMDLDAETKDEVVETLAALFGLSEDEIDDLIVMEDEDENEDGRDDDDDEDGRDDDEDEQNDEEENGREDDDEDENGREDLESDAVQAIYLHMFGSNTDAQIDTSNTFEWIDIDSQDRDEVIEELAEYLDLSEDEVEDLIVIEEGDFEDGSEEGLGVDRDGVVQDIFLYVFDGQTGVEIDTENTMHWLSIDSSDRDTVIEEIADFMMISEDDVEDTLVIEEGSF